MRTHNPSIASPIRVYLKILVLVLLGGALLLFLGRIWRPPAHEEVSAPAIQQGSSQETAAPVTGRPVPADRASAAIATSQLSGEAGLADPQSTEQIRHWAETDPAAAAQWAEQLGPGPARAQALEQVAIAWANTDVAKAASWVSALPEDTAKPTAVLAFSYEAARTNPVTALDLAGDLPPSPERDRALLHSIRQWAAKNPGAASTWAMEVPDPALRSRLLAAVVTAAAENAGPAAATLAAVSLPAGEEQTRAAVCIVQRWAQTAPQDAADWVEQFPDSPMRMTAAENLFAIWAFQDPAAASARLAQLPPGSLKDAALAGYNQTTAAMVADVAPGW